MSNTMRCQRYGVRGHTYDYGGACVNRIYVPLYYTLVSLLENTSQGRQLVFNNRIGKTSLY